MSVTTHSRRKPPEVKPQREATSSEGEREARERRIAATVRGAAFLARVERIGRR
jgi:hypothetical protein